MNELPVVRLGIAELERRLGVERSTIYRWYRAGKFPEPHFLMERRVWFLGEIEAWERQQMARPAKAISLRREGDMRTARYGYPWFEAKKEGDD